MSDDLLIVVDERDRELEYRSKRECHDGDGILHRAFSLFLFDTDGRLLLQQRSAEKRLWPLHWSNTCCSHPRKGEEVEDAVHRRLREELGMTLEADTLRYLYKFQYHARFEDAGSEREVCWVYTGASPDAVKADASEIAQWRWVTREELEAELDSAPNTFTPWFKLEWPEVSRSG